MPSSLVNFCPHLDLSVALVTVSHFPLVEILFLWLGALTYPEVFALLLLFVFETESLYIVLSVLELTI